MTPKRQIFRILDANFNRSREGLRVCEDVARFMLGSSVITRELKSVRHGISAILKSTPGMTGRLLKSRDARRDCGKIPDPKIELPRRETQDIFSANIERAKESIRVLEEFYKLIDNKSSVKLLRLRFRTYDVEKKALRLLRP